MPLPPPHGFSRNSSSYSKNTMVRQSLRSTKEAKWFWVFISPWVLGFLLLTLLPAAASVVMGFMRWDIFNPPRFVGFANYIRLIREDSIFTKAIGNTIFYALVSNLFVMSASLFIAYFLHKTIKGIILYRIIIYLPSVIPMVAAAMLFRRVFSPGGFLNQALALIGIDGPAWLLDPSAVLWALAIMSLWGIGGSTILLLAGMNGVSPSLYEAAALDGAKSIKVYFHITLPLLSPVIFFNLIMGLIGGLQAFGEVYVLTQGGGGPDHASTMIVMHLYNHAFKYFNMGYASGIAWILFAMIMLLTVLVFRSSALWVYYETEFKR